MRFTQKPIFGVICVIGSRRPVFRSCIVYALSNWSTVASFHCCMRQTFHARSQRASSAKQHSQEMGVGRGKKCTPCLKKVLTFILSVTLSNLNRFSHFLHCWKPYEICYKTLRHYAPRLRRVATLPWEIKNSNFWPHVNCACVPQRFSSLSTPHFVKHFSVNSSVNLLAVYPFKYKLLLKSCPRRWIPCWLFTNTAVRSAATIFCATNWSQK